MPRKTQRWNPEPAPFGNARGLDYVAVDVQARIAHRFGATITAGHFADDIQTEQEAAEAPQRDREREPFAAITVSYDGLTISGEDRDGNGHTSGYRSSYWLDRMDAETVVFDLRTIGSDADAISYAVRGPMIDPSLPPGTMSAPFEPAETPFTEQIVSNYLDPIGGLPAVGY